VDVEHPVHGICFEWDAVKAAANAAKHRVSFGEACEVFFDPFVRVSADQANGGEARQNVTGLTLGWRLLRVVYTVRAGERYRIISARTTTVGERRRYEQQ
jgi:uncharacterized protein